MIVSSGLPFKPTTPCSKKGCRPEVGEFFLDSDPLENLHPWVVASMKRLILRQRDV